MSDFGGTFHRGDRNFGNGYEMLLHIEALEAENARLRGVLREIATGKNAAGEKVDFFQDIASAALTNEGSK